MTSLPQTPAWGTPHRGSGAREVGPYTLMALLGEGGMGVVHLARRAPDGPRVALKVLRPHIVGDREARQRLAREVSSLSRIRSRWVAEIVDADPWAPTPYVAMRYVPGASLHDQVAHDGPVPAADLVHFAACLAEGVASAHAVGVLHRDVKPSNVLMEGRAPILIDFGLARVADDPRLTHTGWLLGTPGYLAPEILYGENATAASDVHSWAATVAYGATGRAPFGGGPPMAIMDRVRLGHHDLTAVPEPLRALLTACLDPDPQHRPELAAVRAWLRAQPDAAGSVPPHRPVPTAVPRIVPAVVPTVPPVVMPPVPPTAVVARRRPRSGLGPTQPYPGARPSASGPDDGWADRAAPTSDFAVDALPDRWQATTPPPAAWTDPAWTDPAWIDPWNGPRPDRASAEPARPERAWPDPAGTDLARADRAWAEPTRIDPAPPEPRWSEPVAAATAPAAERVRRAVLLLGAVVVVGALAAAFPWVTLMGLAVSTWLLRSGSAAASSAGELRRLRGRRWYDGVRFLLAAPFHLVGSLPGTALLLLWSSGLAVAAALVCWDAAVGAPRTLFVSGVVFAAAAWSGPGGDRVRSPLARVVRRPASRWRPWLLAVGVVLAAALVLGDVADSRGTDWTPGSHRPFGHAASATR